MNVPPYIIAQLEKANDVIRRQSAELDRLRSSDLQIENIALRTQLMEIAQDFSRSNSADCRRITSFAFSGRDESLARDKDILQERCIELERKYKKAKAASREFEKLIDLISNAFQAEPCSSNAAESPSLLDRSRKKHLISPSRKLENGSTDSLQMCLENTQIEIEDLRARLEKEINISKSLHDDLDLNRKLVLERDEQLNDLTTKLRAAELKCQQTEDHLSRTSTDLALERARCDELTLSLQESEALLTQTRSDCLSYALENQRLAEEVREANQQIVSYRAKLEAQGADLIATKKTLRALQREKGSPVSLTNTGIIGEK
ncbi:hypothetical protein ANCCEY_09140 [Ancylostoma ceylanicum]|uniref:Uncharacterized protein n=1 Tax=Ancylostoma ceylanicum TaxID=53326 RepID=A0A0D6LP34_9BILA|nr:hypothetical protein ANCCEY_09140 [Ancylostoma ceylanicum]